MSSLAALRVLIDERDAAIRERDAAVAESERRLRLCETMKRDGDSARFHAAVAQARVAELEAASGGGEGPRGWLTGEERRFVHWWAHENRKPTDEELDAFKIAAKALLGRSTPPEVELPDWVKMCVSHGRKNQLLAALAAAGVAVKEVQ